MDWDDMDISEDAKMMLDELLQRKRKWDKLQSDLMWVHIFSFFSFALFAYFFYQHLIRFAGGQVWVMLSRMGDNPAVLLLLLVFLGSLALARSVANKCDEAKTKYEDLRKEAIDKFKSDWQKNIKSEARDAISRRMQAEHDINLIYKS